MKTVFLAFAIFSGLLSAACGGNDDVSPPPTEADAGVTLVTIGDEEAAMVDTVCATIAGVSVTGRFVGKKVGDKGNMTLQVRVPKTGKIVDVQVPRSCTTRADLSVCVPDPGYAIGNGLRVSQLTALGGEDLVPEPVLLCLP